jgi:hypothetical protein
MKFKYWKDGNESILLTSGTLKLSPYDGRPPQSLSEARRGKKVLAFFLHFNCRGGVPSGGGGNLRNE